MKYCNIVKNCSSMLFFLQKKFQEQFNKNFRSPNEQTFHQINLCLENLRTTSACFTTVFNIFIILWINWSLQQRSTDSWINHQNTFLWVETWVQNMKNVKAFKHHKQTKFITCWLWTSWSSFLRLSVNNYNCLEKFINRDI